MSLSSKEHSFYYIAMPYYYAHLTVVQDSELNLYNIGQDI